MKYWMWKCDNGTFDVCTEEGVVHANLPEEVARRFVAHDGLIKALQDIADAARAHIGTRGHWNAGVADALERAQEADQAVLRG